MIVEDGCITMSEKSNQYSMKRCCTNAQESRAWTKNIEKKEILKIIQNAM